MLEGQEIYCHHCDRYVQFKIDMSLNGNHVLNCPNCGHEHCRVVKDGVITGDRWDSRNGNSISINPHTINTTATSTWSTYNGTPNTSTGSFFMYQLWSTAT